MEKILRPKYQVQRISESGELVGTIHYLSTDPEDVNSPFTLMPRKDPAAFAAMVTYARTCEPQLAKEIMTWLRKIVEAPVIFGTQGGRNSRAMRVRNLGLFDTTG